MQATRRSRFPRGVWVPLGVLGAATIAAITGAVLVGGDATDSVATAERLEAGSPQATALLRYEEQVVPLVREGGQVVEMGIKVGMADLSEDDVIAPEIVAEQARAWNVDLLRIGSELGEIEPPPALADAHTAFLAALAGYAEAAALVEQAATGEAGEERERLLDEVTLVGRQADEKYDSGARAVQAHRRANGLGPSPDFPDIDAR